MRIRVDCEASDYWGLCGKEYIDVDSKATKEEIEKAVKDAAYKHLSYSWQKD